MIKFSMHGAAGKMGKQIIQTAYQEGDFQLVGACDRAELNQAGLDVGTLSGIEPLGLELHSELEDCLQDVQVLIDFSFHDATKHVLEVAGKMGVPLVIGTTGLNDQENQLIKEFSEKVACVKASNMSIGINLLFKLCVQVSKILGDAYDVEIVEAHHRWKKDAPSGTAMTFAELLAAAKDLNVEKDLQMGRHGNSLKRSSQTIGVHAVRAGDIVGDHTIVFGGDGERIELTHRAHSRETFARGALRAARFVIDAKPGLYDMQDVLGLKDRA